MKKPLKLTLIIIGALGLIAGIYLAVSGSDFIEYFSSILCGILLIWSALLNKGQGDTKKGT